MSVTTWRLVRVAGAQVIFNMIEKTLHPNSIGCTALDLLSQPGVGAVWGITSRGVFIKLPSGWMVFISGEKFRGPLTINLVFEAIPVENIQPDDPVHILNDQIVLPSLRVSIDCSASTAWEMPELPLSLAEQGHPQFAAYSCFTRPSVITDLAIQASARFPKIGQGLLPLLLNERLHEDCRSVSQARLLFPQLREAILYGEGEGIAAGLIPFLGLGTGLTPSGDDLVLGFLLTLNRWKEILKPRFDPDRLTASLIHEAQRRTTTLSANLIECAGGGQADERLVLALDGLVTGEPDREACLTALASWGGTSGFDALVGMSLLFPIQLPPALDVNADHFHLSED